MNNNKHCRLSASCFGNPNQISPLYFNGNGLILYWTGIPVLQSVEYGIQKLRMDGGTSFIDSQNKWRGGVRFPLWQRYHNSCKRSINLLPSSFPPAWKKRWHKHWYPLKTYRASSCQMGPRHCQGNGNKTIMTFHHFRRSSFPQQEDAGQSVPIVGGRGWRNSLKRIIFIEGVLVCSPLKFQRGFLCPSLEPFVSQTLLQFTRRWQRHLFNHSISMVLVEEIWIAMWWC